MRSPKNFLRTLALFFVVGSLGLLTSCAFGPVMGTESARSVGAGGKSVDFGYGQAGYLFKFNYGLMADWDLGLQLEALSFGLRTKYAFINNRELGFSVAGAVGIGSSIGGSHMYLDLMGSYLNSGWEPYAIVRFVKVRTDSSTWTSTSSSFVENTTIPSVEYDYSQGILGLRYWFTPGWAFGIEGGTFLNFSGARLQSNALLMAAFGTRF